MSFGRFRDDSSSTKNSSVSGSSEPSLTSNSGRRDAYIGKGSKITGNLHFSGPIELDGNIEGEVTAEDRLTVGESAVVNARLSGAEVIVKGQVTGDIVASRRIVLKKPARVVGSLSAPLLSIDEGVLFEGKIAMIAAEKKFQEAEARSHASGKPGESASGTAAGAGGSTGKPGLAAVS